MQDLISDAKKGFDLSELEVIEPDEQFVSEMKQGFARIEEYKKKYGDKWQDRYREDFPCAGYKVDSSFDRELSMCNEGIYNGRPFLMVSINMPTAEAAYNEARRIQSVYEKRMREVYGFRFDSLRKHPKGDPIVVKLLLEDAVKTGKWRELPECLYDQYRVLSGGDS